MTETKTIRYFAGVGSRQTPPDIIAFMSVFAMTWCSNGWSLRSGGAEGADAAFEHGCRSVQGKMEIFTAANATPLSIEFAHELLNETHWQNLTPYARQLHGRNVQIVMGRELTEMVEFVVCWTPGARETGGTATAIKVATRYGIPVYNLADAVVLRKIRGQMERVREKQKAK